MIFASNNKDKLREIEEILTGYKIVSMKDAKLDHLDPEEDQPTFYGNARKKAYEIYEYAKEPVIAEDSGLCIDIYDGWPGVETKRFLDSIYPNQDNNEDIRNEYILERMRELDKEQRKATVHCSVVYFDGKKEIVGTGIINGYISTSSRGENGFGFDHIFELENGLTLAELSREEKNQVSARKLALLDFHNNFNL